MGRGKAPNTLTEHQKAVMASGVMEDLIESIAAGDRLYETSPINGRRTKAQINAIQTAIYTSLSGDHPQTVRGVFYQMEVAGIVPKDMSGYNVVQRECLKMRRAGVIPYAWITDGTRLQRKPTSYDDIGDFYFQAAKVYRRSLWADANVSVEIWCEKEAMAGVLFEETGIWDVPLMVARGFSSESFLHSTAEQIKKDGRPTYIYHFGDHDPSGRIIDRQIERGLRRLAPDADIRFARLAVTTEQIATWDLPTRPTKQAKNRHAANFVGRSVELDAIPAWRLRGLVRDAIRQHVDPHALNAVQVAERAELDGLRVMAQRELRRTYTKPGVDVLMELIDTRQEQARKRWEVLQP